MKYNFTFKALGFVLSGIVKKAIGDKAICRNIEDSYRQIVLRASDIGSGNRLLGSYGLAAFFIAMNRNDGLSPEENYQILEDGLRNSRAYKALMGDSSHYFSEKSMEARRAWSKQTYERKYKNDWVVDVLEKTDEYEFGFDYHECGACKLFRDEHCFELARYLCRLDFMTTEMMGVRLTRTMTLADGCEKCDFRFHKD